MGANSSKKKTPKAKNAFLIAVAIACFATTGWVIFGGDNEYADVAQNPAGPGFAASGQPATSSAIDTQPVAATGGKPIVAPRLTAAPRHDHVKEAASLISSSVDPNEAREFVSLASSIRVQRQLGQLSKLQADNAKYSYEAIDWASKAEKIKTGSGADGEFMPAAGEMPTDGFMSGVPEPQPFRQGSSHATASSSDSDAEVSAKGDGQESIRMASGVTANGAVLLAKGKEYANIRMGQTAWGRYRLDDVDSARNCITLQDTKGVKEVLPICYQGFGG